ncbi:MAG: glutathione peroxidase [Ferruginibacter sp.]
MTTRQKILKAVYPIVMWFGKKGKDTSVAQNKHAASVPFYSLKDTTISGQPFEFSKLQGKKVMLVNTASDCGFTGQYDELEKLYKKFEGELVIIGFPANDFKQQEQATDEEIAQFCKINFGVTFPLMKKSSVVRSENQNPVFKWLTDPAKNGWNMKQPEWNFSKYLINENGQLSNYFAPAVSPMDEVVLKAINE